VSEEPRRIVGPVQHYAWGDRSFIPTLLGVEPDGEPWAELWLGTHPSGPAHFADGAELGSATGELPYLLKVLAAAEPLSLQTHPTAAQAVEGHQRGAYSDASAKPELLVALTDFEALCGVRPVESTASILAELGLGDIADHLIEHGPGAVLDGLYRRRIDARPMIEACRASTRPEALWVTRLESMYPGDPSVAATLLLNHVVLAPGDAIHLTAGNLHAYLCGAGIELMGASDNVVRGGLTVKPVDVDELLAVVDPTPLEQPLLTDAARTGRYELPEAHCALVRIESGSTHRSTGHELAISLDGGAWYLPPGARYSPDAAAFVVVSAPTTR
jgi:mannose-6-phosphate isomerase